MGQKTDYKEREREREKSSERIRALINRLVKSALPVSLYHVKVNSLRSSLDTLASIESAVDFYRREGATAITS